MAKTPEAPAKQPATESPPTNLFGDVLNGLKAWGSLFGADKQTFSNQPAVDNLSTAAQAATNAGMETANLAAIAQRNSSALANQNAQIASQTRVNEARALQAATSRGGGSSYQGPGAFLDFVDSLGARGLPGYVSASQAENNFRNQRNQALQSTELFGRANANVDAYKARQLNQAQLGLQQGLANIDIDKMNRQSSLQSQSDANAFLRQRQLGAQQIEGQKAIAGIQAQGNILSSLFGSVGSGSPNYRYWN